MRTPSKGKTNQPLSAKQRKFAQIWAETGNASQACRDAGYSEDYRGDLSAHVGILKYKATLEKKSTEKVVNALAIDRVFVLSGLAKLAQLPADETRGTITGQVNAYSEIGEIIGLKVKLSADLTKQFEGKSREELEYLIKHGYYPDVDRNQPRPN